MSPAASFESTATSRTALVELELKGGSSKRQKASQPGLAGQLLLAGSAACVADLITFPLDTAKVRLQVQGESHLQLATQAGPIGGQQQANYRGVLGTVGGIARREGPRALYNGIVPGLQRQMAFSAIRFGLYEHVKEFYQLQTGVNSGFALVLVRVAAGTTTGAMAIMSAQPTDVVKVRMQAEVKVRGQRSRYNGVLDAYSTIAREEGIRGLYKGAFPNIARMSIINVGEIVVYDIVKDSLISSQLMKDGIPCHFSAAVAAGFSATLLASPVDVVKTRFMNSPDGRYRGALHCAIETGRNEGVKAFYKGFNASLSRLLAWNVCLWITYEQFKKTAQKFYD